MEDTINGKEMEEYEYVRARLNIEDFAEALDMVVRQGLECNAMPRRMLHNARDIGLLSTLAKYQMAEEDREEKNNGGNNDGNTGGGGGDDNENKHAEPKVTMIADTSKRMSCYQGLCQILMQMLRHFETTETHFWTSLSHITKLSIFPCIDGGAEHMSSYGEAFGKVLEFYEKSMLPLEMALGNYNDRHLFLQYPCVFHTPNLLKIFFKNVPPQTMTSNAIVTTYLTIANMSLSASESFFSCFYTAMVEASFMEHEKHSKAEVLLNHTLLSEDIVLCSAKHYNKMKKESFDDYNFDGFMDASYYLTGSKTSSTAIYLFNPNTKSFEYSEELSATFIDLDKNG